MTTTIQSYSVQILTYLTLSSVMDFEKDADSPSQRTFGTLILEHLHSWLEKLDECEYQDAEELTIIKEDLLTEFKNGSFLGDGEETFLRKLRMFLGDDAENRVFYKLTRQALEELPF